MTIWVSGIGQNWFDFFEDGTYEQAFPNFTRLDVDRVQQKILRGINPG